MKTYTQEFKLTLIKLADSGHPTKELSEEYGVCRSTINAWRRAYKEGSSSLSGRPKVLSADEQRIKALEKQVKELTLEREILKKVAAVAL